MTVLCRLPTTYDSYKSNVDKLVKMRPKTWDIFHEIILYNILCSNTVLKRVYW